MKAPIYRTMTALESWCIWCDHVDTPLNEAPCLHCMCTEVDPVFWQYSNDCMWTAFNWGIFIPKPFFFEDKCYLLEVNKDV